LKALISAMAILEQRRIAVLHTQLNCIDGVSLEANKWIASYKRLGHKVFPIAGKFCFSPKKPFLVLPEISADCPVIESIRKMAFEHPLGKEEKKNLHKLIDCNAEKISKALSKFIKENNIDVLHVENVLTLPFNIPLGIALANLIGNKKMPAVVRHHDFFWERNYYITHNNVPKILGKNFPPKRGIIKHVTISRRARNDLLRWTGIEATAVPNYFDFVDIQKQDSYNRDFRESFGIAKGDILLLQPTRILERKRIERSIEFSAKLSKALKKNCVLLITGPPAINISPDYLPMLSNKTRGLGANVVFGHKQIFLHRKKNEKGEKVYSIADAYAHADMVTFPSDIEGFGNVVIEACVHKKPLFTHNYPVLKEILEKGFDFLLMESDEIQPKLVNRAKKLLSNAAERKKMVEKNYRLAKQHYSMEKLDSTTKALLQDLSQGFIREMFARMLDLLN